MIIFSDFYFFLGNCYGALFQGVDPGDEDDDDEFEFDVGFDVF